MIVKVCGLCDSDNLKDLSRFDIDWVGMIFYDVSSRYVEADEKKADQMKSAVTSVPKVKKIGVFVNEKLNTILAKAKAYSLDIIQLHGSESPEMCKMIKESGLSLVKAFAVNDDFDFRLLNDYAAHCDYFLFDTKGKLPGGNGVTFNWSVLKKYALDVPFLLSGGIGPEQVAALKAFRHPQWIGVDLNSRFEISPGLKSVDKLKKFIEEVQDLETDLRH